MRSTRIVSALVALIMALTMSLAFNAPAANSAAKQKHDITVSGKEIGNSGKFKAFGKVSTYKNRKIKIQRKVGKGAYKFYKDTKTKANGHFSVGIDGPTGSCFKVVVPSTKNYKTTKAKVGCIVPA